MPRTINKHIRIDEELWNRLEKAAGECDTTANRLVAELAERWLETREWLQSEVQVRVARTSLLTAQAIALDMIIEIVAGIGYAVGPFVDRELAQVGIRPAHRGLDEVVKRRQTDGLALRGSTRTRATGSIIQFL